VSSRLVFDGLAELREQLRNLPSDLTAEATHEVEGAANGAAAEIKRAYPVRTGNLRDGVIVTHVNQGKYAAGALVKNTSKHAFIFENGTQTRHNDLGANRGAMPPGNVFIPAAIRARRLMYEKLKAIVARAGFTVSGDV